MSANSFNQTPQVLTTFRSSEDESDEVKTENKLVFLALHALGRKALRVITDGVRISFIYKKSEVQEDINRIMNGLTNGVDDKDGAPMIDLLIRLLLGWTVWETFLNQMRDLNRPKRR